jgi:hypothetical protein
MKRLNGMFRLEGEHLVEMQLAEWTAHLVHELKLQGFDVVEHQGFPLVKPRMDGSVDPFNERIRLLEYEPSLNCERHIYAEGMIFLPIGAGAILRKEL